ncbi:hypothetical protein E2C01_078527 [Portunus trituberculatus]|uniref:Uncharacterized protein n=1 Tax=Portunus trituberculatus TaxID=210409 RepID=A0A5B7IP23_PORTR|nr:hypothetical protein [Portunus trituberculatus]
MTLSYHHHHHHHQQQPRPKRQYVPLCVTFDLEHQMTLLAPGHAAHIRVPGHHSPPFPASTYAIDRRKGNQPAEGGYAGP